MGTNIKTIKQLELLRDRRWTEKDARVVLEAVARSGASVSAFAREHGMSAPRIFWWRRKLEEGQMAAAAEIRDEVEGLSFAPVVLTGTGKGRAVVVRVGAVEIEVADPGAVDPRWLTEVVTSLGGA